MAKVTYTQRELDMIEQAKQKLAARASKPVLDADGAQIGVTSAAAAAAPKPTIVGDTIYGSGRTPTATATPASTLPSGMETRTLPGGGTVTAAPSVLDAPSTLPPEKYVVDETAQPKTVAESVGVLQDNWKEFEGKTLDAADRGGILRTLPGEDRRPLVEFKTELADTAGFDQQAQAELNAGRRERSDARLMRRSLVKQMQRGRDVDPGALERANKYLETTRRGTGGTDNVDDQMEAARRRLNPHITRRFRGVSQPAGFDTARRTA
jgi:hypothetical protein